MKSENERGLCPPPAVVPSVGVVNHRHGDQAKRTNTSLGGHHRPAGGEPDPSVKKSLTG